MRFILAAIPLILLAVGCGGGSAVEEPPKGGNQDVAKATQPAPAAKPEKTPEEIAAEKMAAREKRIAELLERAKDGKASGMSRLDALRQLSGMDPFPRECVEAALALVREDDGNPPEEGPFLGQPALQIIAEAPPEFIALAVDDVLAAASDPSKGGLFKADLIAQLPRIAPAERGVHVLVAALKDEMNHNIARNGLVEYGRPSVKPLIEAVRTFEAGMARSQAMMALGKIGADAVEAVPTLIEVLKTGGMQDVGSAAEALGEFGPLAKEALPALAEVAEGGMFGAREAKEAMAKIKG